MASLLMKTDGVVTPLLELRPGSNSIGRAQDNQIQILHLTLSLHHCDVILDAHGLTLRDCYSTNGSFVDGKRVDEALLRTGQTIRLGDVELEVISTLRREEDPRSLPPSYTPLVILANGIVICPKHKQNRATFQCTNCREVMCALCVNRLRRHGGKAHCFCPYCSKMTEPIDRSNPAPPMMLTDGTVLCPRHEQSPVCYQCTECRELMCEACVLRRRRQGKIQRFCPFCACKVASYPGNSPKKESLLEVFKQTMRLPSGKRK